MSGPLPSRLRIGPDSRRFGNGSQWTRTLDQNYAIDAISSAALNLDATLDDVGNFTGLNSSGQSYEFGYDPLYRLTDLSQGSSVLEHFDYDATGNRIAANLGGAAQSYAYPTNSHRLQSINGVSRDYDNVGNTTRRDGLNYTYNGRTRLSRVSMGRTTYYSNTYNARGEREEKSLTNGMTVQRFIYDEAGRLIQTGNVSPVGLTRTLKPQQRLLWLDDQLVGVKIKATSGAYAGELLYAHTDHLGTPRALSRASNNSTVWRWPLETSAFGQHPAQPDPDGDGQALTFNLRYPGQYFDAESGLHYNYFRDYEAGTGRYIESDPIGLDGGISTYGYVANQPLSLTDPQGLDYWVEDADPSESGLGFHQSVCVGKLGTPNRYCISFGRKPGQADCWFECKGHVYRDRSPPGDVVRPFHRMTSPETDRQIRTYLESRLGDADRPWDALGGENCRAFSQNVFGYLLRTYDGLPSPYSGK